MKKSASRGFTLIEVLVVIGIIAILAAIVVIAINPARQFSQANNSQRWSNVNAILNAVHQYAVDNQGQLPPYLSSATTTERAVCADTAVASSSCTDLEGSLIPTYIVGMPTDPTGATGDFSGYTIGTTSGNRVIVKAPSAENGETIQVTR